jgi:hypothetical protein
VRPTDENQPGSRRPNLMSPSRRAIGEINILAMLDGQAPGRRLRTLPAVVRYGAAGVLACSLLVALAWLVRGAAPARDAGAADAAQASAQSSQSTQPIQPIRPIQPIQPTQSLRPAPGTRDAGNARDILAVDVPSMRATLATDTPVSVPAPDMVASPDAAGPARGAVIIDLPQPAPAMTPAVTARAAAGTETTRAVARHAATRPTTPAIPFMRPQPALRANSSQALAHADRTPPRQKRTAGASRATPPSAAVDTDVAVISAILQHTGPRDNAGDGAADGAGAAACADKPCGPRMPPRQ